MNFEVCFASRPLALHKICLFEDSQMLADGLPAEGQAVCEFADREFASS